MSERKGFILHVMFSYVCTPVSQKYKFVCTNLIKIIQFEGGNHNLNIVINIKRSRKIQWDSRLN